MKYILTFSSPFTQGLFNQTQVLEYNPSIKQSDILELKKYAKVFKQDLKRLKQENAVMDVDYLTLDTMEKE